MASTSVPVYFEESWAILSSIGLVNVLFGLMVVGITTLSPISIVPIVVSCAGAIANGLCYYAFYANYSKSSTLIAAVFADLTWLIQEAGLSFYSYLILTRVLKSRSRIAFMVLFWSLMCIISTLRILILVSRARNIINGNDAYQMLVSRLHIGYFTSIAVIECISAFFLLRKFASARRTSIEASSTSGLFSYLMRSTEIRLATLALIGITRAITYSFQTAAQSATNTASQVDRFVYTMECMFPIMLFIDILASKLVVANHIHESSSQSRGNRAYIKSSGGRTRRHNNTRMRGDDNIQMYNVSHIETRVDAQGNISSSQERIVERERSQSGSGTLEAEELDLDRKGGINKTVEFEFHESSV